MSYEILHTDSAYRGHAFSVEQLLTRLPDGNQKTYELVRRQPAVTIVPVGTRAEIYFVRQYRIGADHSLLELPAGLLEAGEDPAVGAGRELREEIGLAAGKLLKLGDFFMAPGYSNEFMTIFLATELYPAPLIPDDDEFLQVETMSLQKAYEMAETGQIEDGKTLAAFLLARPHLNVPPPGKI